MRRSVCRAFAQKDRRMQPEDNLRASIPPALLVEAQAEQITVDQLVQSALERRLAASRLRKLCATGQARARKLGIREEDVDRVIHEFREEERQRRSEEPER